jgi:DNA-binding MarR family transcriptional regulator
MPSKSIHSWDAVQQAIDARRPDGEHLPLADKMLLATLTSYVGPQNGLRVYPGQATLAGRLDVSERAICRRLANLEKWGLIERQRRYKRGDGGGRTSDLIHLTLLPDDVVRSAQGLPDDLGDLPDRSGDRRRRSRAAEDAGLTQARLPGLAQASASTIRKTKVVPAAPDARRSGESRLPL